MGFHCHVFGTTQWMVDKGKSYFQFHDSGKSKIPKAPNTETETVFWVVFVGVCNLHCTSVKKTHDSSKLPRENSLKTSWPMCSNHDMEVSSIVDVPGTPSHPPLYFPIMKQPSQRAIKGYSQPLGNLHIVQKILNFLTRILKIYECRKLHGIKLCMMDFHGFSEMKHLMSRTGMIKHCEVCWKSSGRVPTRVRNQNLHGWGVAQTS